MVIAYGYSGTSDVVGLVVGVVEVEDEVAAGLEVTIGIGFGAEVAAGAVGAGAMVTVEVTAGSAVGAGLEVTAEGTSVGTTAGTELVLVLVGAAGSGRTVVTPVGLVKAVVMVLELPEDELPLQLEPVSEPIVLSLQLLVPAAQPRRRLAMSEA